MPYQKVRGRHPPASPQHYAQATEYQPSKAQSLNIGPGPREGQDSNRQKLIITTQTISNHGSRNQ